MHLGFFRYIVILFVDIRFFFLFFHWIYFLQLPVYLVFNYVYLHVGIHRGQGRAADLLLE